jgi:hypothetical protein
MSDKRAFVFDTNFIIEHTKDLKEVVNNLAGKFNIYVTQVSIDERISQQCLEMKKKYDAIPKLINEYHGIANIEITIEIAQKYQAVKEGMQRNYGELVFGNIIPFLSRKEMLDVVLDRVYKKIPPFSIEEKASDKGFKDTLMWYSVLEYFRDNGEDEVIFVTNDGGFTKNLNALQLEFNEFTGKKIEIHDNSYYRDLIKKEEQPTNEQTLPDVRALRDKIQNIIPDMCYTMESDNWGNNVWYDAFFTLSVRVSADDIETMFCGLKKVIENNIFENGIQAYDVLQLGDTVIDNRPIPIIALQEVLKLYEEIRDKTSDYLPRFFTAAANIINRNYKEPPQTDNVDDMPF